jgi:hypothetical protein
MVDSLAEDLKKFIPAIHYGVRALKIHHHTSLKSFDFKRKSAFVIKCKPHRLTRITRQVHNEERVLIQATFALRKSLSTQGPSPFEARNTSLSYAPF